MNQPINEPHEGPSTALRVMPEVLYHVTTSDHLRWIASAGIVPEFGGDEVGTVPLWNRVPVGLGELALTGKPIALVEVDFSSLAPDLLRSAAGEGADGVVESASWRESLDTVGAVEHEGVVPRLAIRRVASLTFEGHSTLVGSLCGVAQILTGRPLALEIRLLEWIFGEENGLSAEEGLQVEKLFVEEVADPARRLKSWDRELSTRNGLEVFDLTKIPR